MGFSGPLSRLGASVFSAHCFSESEGWRPFSNKSVTGDSARAFPSGLRLSDMSYPIGRRTLHASRCEGREQGASATREQPMQWKVLQVIRDMGSLSLED